MKKNTFIFVWPVIYFLVAMALRSVEVHQKNEMISTKEKKWRDFHERKKSGMISTKFGDLNSTEKKGWFQVPNEVFLV